MFRISGVFCVILWLSILLWLFSYIPKRESNQQSNASNRTQLSLNQLENGALHRSKRVIGGELADSEHLRSIVGLELLMTYDLLFFDL